MAKKEFAPPVTNFSISCDPSLVDWLNNYAHKKRTSRSKIVRKALIDFRAEHTAEPDENAAIMDVKTRCIICDAMVVRQPGIRAICSMSSAHIQESVEAFEYLRRPNNES